MISVGVVDLGTGNLFSVLRGLERAGAEPIIVRTPEEVSRAPRLVLPGVGSFADASRRARALGLAQILHGALEHRTPVLGICLGMQLLFDEGEEDGSNPGLGLMAGRVVKLRGGAGLTVPHVGWQQLSIRQRSAVLPDPSDAPWFYFSHSYRAVTAHENISAVAVHGEEVPAIVEKGTLFGIQPHPEKSGAAGLAFLQRFLALEARPA